LDALPLQVGASSYCTVMAIENGEKHCVKDGVWPPEVQEPMMTALPYTLG
jgi:hypothetical protein